MKNKGLNIAILESLRMVPGGGEKVLPNVSKYLSKRNNVTVFTPKKPKKSLDFGNVKIKIIHPSGKFSHYLAFLKLKLKKEFDLVIYGCFPTTLASFRNKEFPSIHISHSPPRVFYGLKKYLLKNSNMLGKLKIHLKNILFKKMDYLAVQNIDKILGISKEIEKRIKRDYHRKSNVFYAGIDPKKFKGGKYRDYILSVARIVKPKRPEIIVKSMKQVKNKNIKMIMVGTGNIDKEISRLAKKYPNVDFRGFVSDKDLLNLYSNCLAAVYIPINEDMGYVPMEAGACGKCTIGVNEGGLKDLIIEGKTGFLIKNITAKKLAKKIDILANNKKLAKKMGKAAKKYTKKFYLENTFPVLEKTIVNVLKNSKRK